MFCLGWAAIQHSPRAWMLQVDAGMDEEAGVSHLLPKVMVPYVTRAGETPRKVQIQRSGPCWEA